jgi:hypothetical protein
MTEALGVWADYGDEQTAKVAAEDLPVAMTLDNEDVPLQVLTVRHDGSVFLHILPVIRHVMDLPQAELRRILNQVMQCLGSTRGLRFAHAGKEVDGVLAYDELISHHASLKEYPGLVIDERLKEAYGEVPPGFVALAPGYYWRPYADERV